MLWGRVVWTSNGFIVVASDIRGPLVRVPDSGGSPVEVTQVPGEGWTHRNPHLLPDQMQVLFIARESREDQFGSIAVASLETGRSEIVVEVGSNPIYARGFLFWVREGNLLAQPFEPKTCQLSGSPTPIAAEISYCYPRDIGKFSVSEGGALGWRRRTTQSVQLARFDLQGREIDAYGESGLSTAADVSHPRRRVLLKREDQSRGGRG